MPHNFSILNAGGFILSEKVFRLNRIMPNIKQRADVNIETPRITIEGCEDRSVKVAM